ncbi:MAG: hypothetical protein LC099_11085 [Anaerolineales bacterium]|nr:hypothetical protein [Anaerolineales bacterium]
MLAASDFVRLSYSPDLTEAGIAYALRSLAYSAERDPRILYNRLRRAAANLAAELAFRRYLAQANIPFAVQAAAPFTDRERFDVTLNGRRCDVKSFLISRREQILQIRADPAVLLEAQALVPSDIHANDGHFYNDLYLFAFATGLLALSSDDLQKALTKKLPHYLTCAAPLTWRRPARWTPFGALTLKSEADAELIVEVNGQDEMRESKQIVVRLPPRTAVRVDEDFYSLTSLRAQGVPQARVGVRSEARRKTILIAPAEWSNLYVYGMDIFFVGGVSYEELSQRATLLPPNSRTFQYERTQAKNLCLPVSKLKPMQKLIRTK